jgi:hypothetical protein
MSSDSHSTRRILSKSRDDETNKLQVKSDNTAQKTPTLHSPISMSKQREGKCTTKIKKSAC